jgi:hypothetical protein
LIFRIGVPGSHGSNNRRSFFCCWCSSLLQSPRHCFGGSDKGTGRMLTLIQSRRSRDALDAILCKPTV